MGEVTGAIADLCILTCDNPRDEEIKDININLVYQTLKIALNKIGEFLKEIK